MSTTARSRGAAPARKSTPAPPQDRGVSVSPWTISVVLVAAMIGMSAALVFGGAVLLAFGAGGLKGDGGMLIWPLFGTTNQLMAALTLSIICVMLLQLRRPVLPVLIVPVVPVLVGPARTATRDCSEVDAVLTQRHGVEAAVTVAASSTSGTDHPDAFARNSSAAV